MLPISKYIVQFVMWVQMSRWPVAARTWLIDGRPLRVDTVAMRSLSLAVPLVQTCHGIVFVDPIWFLASRFNYCKHLCQLVGRLFLVLFVILGHHVRVHVRVRYTHTQYVMNDVRQVMAHITTVMSDHFKDTTKQAHGHNPHSDRSVQTWCCRVTRHDEEGHHLLQL